MRELGAKSICEISKLDTSSLVLKCSERVVSVMVFLATSLLDKKYSVRVPNVPGRWRYTWRAINSGGIGCYLSRYTGTG